MESLIISFLVILLLTWLVWWVIHKMGLPAPILNIAEIIVVVVAAIALIRLVLRVL